MVNNFPRKKDISCILWRRVIFDSQIMTLEYLPPVLATFSNIYKSGREPPVTTGEDRLEQ